MKTRIFAVSALALALASCEEKYAPIVPLEPEEKPEVTYTEFLSRAEATFETVHRLYWSEKAGMMFSSYPNNLGTGVEPSTPEYSDHAFVWGYGAVVSAFSAIVQTTSNLEFRIGYEAEIKATLDRYYNTAKQPNCFACFTNSWDNRLYDDAIWIGIDMADLYDYTGDSWYLEKARSVYEFMLSGMDDKLGGGVYWSEDDKNDPDKASKNTCSNAPAAVMCLKLHQATGNDEYLQKAREIYAWTKENLQDPVDYLYFDNMKLDGTRGTTKFSYNSGQMIQAGVLLYNATGEEQYLTDARNVAEASYKYFFGRFVSPYTGEQFNIIKDGHRWFNAVMMRGFAELNKVEPNETYTDAIYKTLEHAWTNTRDEASGLFLKNFTGTEYGDNPGDILQQGAIAEMFARMSTFK